jgi:hypothetical protein
MSETTKPRGTPQEDKSLTVTGILKDCRARAIEKRGEKLEIVPNTPRFDKLIKDCNRRKNSVPAKPYFTYSQRKNQVFYKGWQEAKRQVTWSGTVSNKVKSYFSFKKENLNEGIYYRVYLLDTVIDVLDVRFFSDAIGRKSITGETIPPRTDTAELIRMQNELSAFEVQIDQGQATPTIKQAYTDLFADYEAELNKEIRKHFKQASKIENLCVSLIDGTDRIRIIKNLSNQSLIKLIRLYVDANNEFYSPEIAEYRKADHKAKVLKAYQHKKESSANQKRAKIQRLKADGWSQSGTAESTGYSLGTVKNYWN